MVSAIDARSPKVAVGLAALLALATLAWAASAQGRGDDDHDRHHHWNGGYYRPPPIIYGSPYRQRYYGSPYYEPPRYYPPPVVYGPGLNFDFQVR